MTKKKNAPPPPESMEAEAPKQLTEDEINSRARRLATVTSQASEVRRRRRRVVRECNEELKELENQAELLAEQITTGLEQVRQGDLFAGDETPGRVGQADAEAALGEVAALAGNGEDGGNHDFEEDDPAPEAESQARGLERVKDFQAARDSASAS